MENEVYVLKYKSGSFVKRDDSHGPMSTGGYPYEVPNIAQATFFPSMEEAAKYAGIGNWSEIEPFVYKVNFVLGEGLEFPVVWEHCNRHCVPSRLSLASSALHYADCTMMKRA